jgi:hypothetical protein
MQLVVRRSLGRARVTAAPSSAEYGCRGASRVLRRAPAEWEKSGRQEFALELGRRGCRQSRWCCPLSASLNVIICSAMKRELVVKRETEAGVGQAATAIPRRYGGAVFLRRHGCTGAGYVSRSPPRHLPGHPDCARCGYRRAEVAVFLARVHGGQVIRRHGRFGYWCESLGTNDMRRFWNDGRRGSFTSSQRCGVEVHQPCRWTFDADIWRAARWFPPFSAPFENSLRNLGADAPSVTSRPS